jgi:short-subunit dehydrogenase
MEGKAVLVTGASGAIGAEVVHRLAARGARLALTARRAEVLEDLADVVASKGATRPVVLPADLGRRGEAAEVAAQAASELGGIDALINNAGASMQGLSWVVGDDEPARAVFETNLWSPLALIAAVAPEMVRSGGGAIVNVGSMARVSPFPHLGVYAASRSALATVTEVLDMELGPRGVRVVEVALGPIDTPASRENRVLAGADRWLDGRPGLGEAGAAADTIVAAVEGDARGVRHYPGVMRWVDRLPGLGRRYARRAARHADVQDTTVR